MKINSTNYIQNVYKAKKAYQATNVDRGIGKRDSVTLSSTAKDLQLAINAVKQAPDVRMDKVNRLKEQIEAGEYNVTAAQIADKILEKNDLNI